MKIKTLFVVSAFFLIGLRAPLVKGAADLAPPRTPGEIIALINAYRAENGLPAYGQNAILMQTAQGQADYQASIGTVTHEGPGGSRPRDRAYAAGYGGGNTIFISEIIYGNTTGGPSSAVNWWKTSQIHNDTMLASTYQEIGAGVAQDSNGRTYYTAVTGWITGVTYNPDVSSSSSSSGSAGTSVPQVVMIPVVKAEPRPDGSVVHIVRTGQTLWTVAAVYGVPLEQVLELNNLPEWAVVYPGDEIIVMPSGSMPTSTATPGGPTDTPTITPTASVTPTPRRTLPSTSVASASSSGNLPGSRGSGSSLAEDPEAAQANSTVRLIVVIALVSILLIIAASFIIQPSSKTEEPEEFDPFAPIE